MAVGGELEVAVVFEFVGALGFSSEFEVDDRGLAIIAAGDEIDAAADLAADKGNGVNFLFQGDLGDFGLTQDLDEPPEALLGGMEEAGARRFISRSEVEGGLGGEESRKELCDE